MAEGKGGPCLCDALRAIRLFSLQFLTATGHLAHVIYHSMTLLTVIWSMIASACFTLAAVWLHGWWRKRELREPPDDLVAMDKREYGESESLFRALTELSPVGIYRADASGLAVYHNDQSLKILGMSREMARGTGWVSALHPDDRKRVSKEWQQAVTEKRAYVIEHRFQHADGSVVWVGVWAQPELDSAGEIVGHLGVLIDVTARKQVDESIKQAEDFSQSVLASLSSHIAILDRNGMIIAVNQAWEKFALANDRASSLVGVGCSYLDVCRSAASTGEATAQHAFEGVRAVLDGSSEFFEMDYPCHSPVESRWFLMRVVPLKIPSGGAVVTHLDISQLRRAEQEAESLRRDLEHAGRVALLGEMSGSLAHELNQPLEAILANAQAARRWLAVPQPDLDEIRLIIEDIIRDDKRAGEIVHSVRALAKKDVPNHQLMDVNRMVRETSSLLSRELLAADVPLVLELQPDLPLVEAGMVELQQALLNLMLNGLQAQDAVQRSCRGLTVSTRNAGDRVILAVRDHGPGLSREITEHMFDAFFTTKSGGLGLGLSLCRHIAESHGGKLSAENHPEGGAVFSLPLPVKERMSS